MKGVSGIVFRGNPIYRKEISIDARAARVFSLILIFNCILAIVTFVLFFTSLNGVSSMNALNYSGLVDMYTLMAYIEFGIVFLVIPSITAGSITGERERKTLDIMLVGSRHSWMVVWGKFKACIQLMLVVLFSSVPILSIVFVYGGIRLLNIVHLIFIITLAGVYMGSVGIFCSSVCKKTTSAIILAYSAVLILILITTVLNFFFANMESHGVYDANYIALHFNPMAPLAYLVSEQLETSNILSDFIFTKTSDVTTDMLMEEWLRNSIIVQTALSAVLLILSAVIINPLKFNFVRRAWMKYGERKDAKKN
ncbi:MAG: ABC transporter permease subunit [Lachnospiraceae bacterium]|nr:ABC transporter permease subunit [Lachnospiraceae bacterium]